MAGDLATVDAVAGTAHDGSHILADRDDAAAAVEAGDGHVTAADRGQEQGATGLGEGRVGEGILPGHLERARGDREEPRVVAARVAHDEPARPGLVEVARAGECPAVGNRTGGDREGARGGGDGRDRAAGSEREAARHLERAAAEGDSA